MYGADRLHWSFNYSRQGQEEFGRQLCEALSSYLGSCDAVGVDSFPIASTYKVLPNFWRGYNHPSASVPAARDLAMGQIAIERRPGQAGTWQYAVSSRNSANGENLRIDFRCRDDGVRTILDRWRIHTENTAGYLYSRYDCSGRLYSGAGNRQEIRLAVGDLEFTAGRCEGDLPLTCNWALFDVIPLFNERTKDKGGQLEIALLEDMEILRVPCRIGFLESIEMEIGRAHGSLHLSGYWVCGRGVVPSYWWVDSRGKVVIVSSTFQTLVLQGVRSGGGGN